jgi:hypothetical protein
MPKHIFILAGSHKEAAFLARDKGLNPMNWTYLYKPEQLLGLRSKPYIRYGTWYKQRFISDIEDMLVSREMQECSDVRLA